MMARSDDAPSSGLDLVAKLTLAVSVGLLIARFGTSDQIGYGDSEALYVVYGLFASPATSITLALLAGSPGTSPSKTACLRQPRSTV